VLKDLRSLETVNLAGCVQLSKLDGLKDLKNLKRLILSNNQFPSTAIDELHRQFPQIEIAYLW
jgi:hypothetical protein